MDSADLELFARSVGHATEAHTGVDLDAALDELGWSEALAVDARAAISVLFEAQGAANVASAALDLVALDALGVEDAASGLVLPALGDSAPPAALDGDRLTVTGVGTVALATKETAVVVATAGEALVAAPVPVAQLELRPVIGLDPRLSLVVVRGDAVVLDAPPQPVDRWATAVARAQLALGHELVGASRTMLTLAREHALERVQFGQTISGFQAVRHRLADTLVAIETADALLDAAWLDQTAGAAAMAKASAGRSARTAARHCQQVLAGIGFTTEHPLHHYIRRALVLDELFGSSLALTRQLGRDLLDRRQLPPLLPL